MNREVAPAALRFDRKPVVLTLLGALWPGNDSSGPNQSFRAMTEALGDEFEFRTVARDGPPGGESLCAETGVWIAGATCSTCYWTPQARRAPALLGLIRRTPHDILMLNGFFDREFTIPAVVARKAGLIPRRPTILSPRGEFSAGALDLKQTRKRTWLSVSRALGLMSDIVLHATSAAERDDVLAQGLGQAKVALAANIRLPLTPAPRVEAPAGLLRIAFVGRLSPVKNVHLALQALQQARARVRFDIYGPPSDPDYVAQCRALSQAMPGNVQVAWRGEIANEQVARAMADADLFLMPSRSENFGHAIFEALSCGVPVLIGVDTPWRDLERDRAGFDLPLDDPATFAQAIDRFAAFDEATRRAFAEGARRRAERWVEESDAAGSVRAMLRACLPAQAAA